jgi:hypothetical protein
MCLSESAGPASDQREEKALEKGCWFVEASVPRLARYPLPKQISGTNFFKLLKRWTFSLRVS